MVSEFSFRHSKCHFWACNDGHFWKNANFWVQKIVTPGVKNLSLLREMESLHVWQILIWFGEEGVKEGRRITRASKQGHWEKTQWMVTKDWRKKWRKWSDGRRVYVCMYSYIYVVISWPRPRHRGETPHLVKSLYAWKVEINICILNFWDIGPFPATQYTFLQLDNPMLSMLYRNSW